MKQLHSSGLKVEFFPVSGRVVTVEAMAADQVDFVLTGPSEAASRRTSPRPRADAVGMRRFFDPEAA
jgi:ABC-type phosphate/phosphonate transport system substrate-binding protein